MILNEELKKNLQKKILRSTNSMTLIQLLRQTSGIKDKQLLIVVILKEIEFLELLLNTFYCNRVKNVVQYFSIKYKGTKNVIHAKQNTSKNSQFVYCINIERFLTLSDSQVLFHIHCNSNVYFKNKSKKSL